MLEEMDERKDFYFTAVLQSIAISIVTLLIVLKVNGILSFSRYEFLSDYLPDLKLNSTK